MNDIKDRENYIIMNFLIFIKSLDLLWSPLSLLFSGFRGCRAGRKTAGGMKLTIQIHLVQSQRIDGATPLFSLHAIMACARTIFTVATLRLLNQVP